MNGIDELARFIAGLQRNHIAAPLLATLRLHVIDIVGAWTAATGTVEGRALIRFPGASEAGDTQPRTLTDEITLHCAMVRSSEVDDIHLASMTTPGSLIVPAAMTIAARLPAETNDVAPAMIAGYEAMIRLGLAIKGPEVLYRGIWPTYFGASFATAAVAARLMRLDAARTAHALAMALTMAAPSVGQHHASTTARWFSVGNAARNGLTAALAARAGFTADVNVLNGRLLPDVFGITPVLAAISEGLGERFMLADVSFKPWCAARQTMAATQALRELVDEGLDIAQIDKVSAAVLPPHLNMINHGVRPGDRASFLTSLPYQMALAVLEPEQTLELNAPSAPPPPGVQALMGKIGLITDDTLLEDYPSAWPARVSAGGRERLVHYVPGDPPRALDEAALQQKFRRLIVPIAGEETADRLDRAASDALESVPALSAAVELLRSFTDGSKALKA